MTLFLFWWLVPLALFLLGCWFMWSARRAECFEGIVPGFIGLGFWLLAVAVCVGHWI